jgi:hypothetical protein
LLTFSREVFTASRHIGFVAASSIRVLNVKPGAFGFFHQSGIRPQRAIASSSAPASESERSRGISVVGTTLKLRPKGS